MNSFFSSPFWRDVERELERAPQFLREGGINRMVEHTVAVRLLRDRLDCIRQACDRADHETRQRLRNMLTGLDIEPILHGLLDTLKEVVLIVGGSIGVGTAVGAGIGAFFGGIGAIPGGAVGAGVGAKVGTWILAALGLKSLAEFFLDGVPGILRSYYQGFTLAWQTGRDSATAQWWERGEQSSQIAKAAGHIADGHVAMVLLLLSAIAAYLMRGKSMQTLAQEARGGRLGDKFARWMEQNEDKLRHPPKLQPQQSRAVGGGGGEPLARKPPSAKSDAGEAQPALPRGMAPKKVRCFEPNDLPKAKIPEFDRQLAGQERGINDMTVEEYLKGRELFGNKDVVRDPKVAREARFDYQEQLTDKLFRQSRTEGLSVREAEKKAAEMATEKMKTLAALHNPDMVAAGKDAISDFGDRNVNSRIGAQWKTRVAELDEAVKRIPEIDRSSIKMNAKLERCK